MRLLPALAFLPIVLSAGAAELAIVLDADDIPTVAQYDCGVRGEFEVTYYPQSGIAELRSLWSDERALLQRVRSLVTGAETDYLQYARPAEDIRAQYHGGDYLLVLMRDGRTWLRHIPVHYIQADRCELTGGTPPDR